MTSWIGRWKARADRWLFDETDDFIVPFMRVCFGILVFIYAGILSLDAGFWFSDQGVLTIEERNLSINIPQWSLFDFLPSDGMTAKICLWLLMGHAVCLGAGVWTRFNSIAIFVWLVSFQNRNGSMLDGEDTVFRLMAFYLMFLPLDRRWRLPVGLGLQHGPARFGTAWALRLIQFQMVLLYASATWCKSHSWTWQDGSIMYHVSRMNDMFGRMVPPEAFDSMTVSKIVTWGALGIEAFIPIGVFFRRTRLLAVVLGFALHLGIELTMNLFLFEWITMFGLLAFLRRSDFAWFGVRRSVPLVSASIGQKS